MNPDRSHPGSVAGEWTPLDDIGRSIETVEHHMRRLPERLARMEDARRDAVAKMDAFLAALAADAPDASGITDAEAEEMAKALDTIHRVRDQLAFDEVDDA